MLCCILVRQSRTVQDSRFVQTASEVAIMIELVWRVWRILHWFAHELGLNKVRTVRYKSESGKEYLMTECIKCGVKSFIAISILASLSCVSKAQVVYNELVTANCLAPSPDGIQAISDEHSQPGEPDWLACLFDGGTVSACNVPCQ
jgi:hypothetical protein